MHSASSELSQMVVTPMTRAEAAIQLSRLLGCYPSINLHDPETYMAAVVSLLCGYPLWVGERAVVELAKSSKFVPNLAEITEVCEDILARRPRAAHAPMLEPPVDPAMQARVGELMAGLSKHLHDNQREAREFALKEVEEKQAPRKAAKIRASWQQRGQEPPAGLITPELADIVQSWKAAAE